MVSFQDQEKAKNLLNEADQGLNQNELTRSAQLLREALNIDPENERAKQLWSNLQLRENEDALPRLCQTFVSTGSEKTKEEILDQLSRHEVNRQTAMQCFHLLVDMKNQQPGTDILVPQLLKQAGAQKGIASEFYARPTATFDLLWRCGDDAVNATTNLLLEATVWNSNEDRHESITNFFQLLLAKVMTGDEDVLELAMKNVGRLLATVPDIVGGVVDPDSFDSILSCLDIRLPTSLRSQTTLVIAKTIEVIPENGQAWLAKYVTSRVARQRLDDLLVAFSAAAGVFPIVPSVAAMLFLTPTFLESLVPILQKNKSATKLQQAALEMFSAACIDKQCRTAIHQQCHEWLSTLVESSTEETLSSLAALILIKTEGSSSPGQASKEAKIQPAGPDDLVYLIRNMVINSETANSTQAAVEAVAYASLRPNVKEELAKDDTFLSKLISILSDDATTLATVFGGCTIIANMTAYPPAQSEDQKRISQLKAYANTSKPAETHPADLPERVTARCKIVLDRGIVPIVVKRGAKASPSLFQLIAQILLSLSREQKNRGTLAQQGAVKILIQAYNSLNISGALPPSPAPTSNTPPVRTAAHALARILISVNPSHVFPSSAALPMTSAVRPLLSLLSDEEAGDQRDLLPTFESLLALTNLASADQTVCETIIRLAWADIESLLLSSNAMVQCAATELVCNVTTCPSGIAKFADGSGQAKNRMHVLLALADVEKMETRRAAGGALAMLSEWEGAAKAILERERGLDIIRDMAADTSEELKQRGLVCLSNIKNYQ
ncbi:MAG: hypothetical protein M1820_008176 [Bogoriella megaspora]|nr:MAG: hypothetical protein M1820_008176 [Bogoriella megaspora]